MKSFGSAINVLKRLYTADSDDSLPADEVFRILGKDRSDAIDAAYVNSRMRLLKHHGLITSSYGMVDGYRRRLDITITPKGRAVFYRTTENATNTDLAKWPHESRRNLRRHVTISSVKQDIDVLRELEPGLEITFTIEFKNDPRYESYPRYETYRKPAILSDALDVSVSTPDSRTSAKAPDVEIPDHDQAFEELTAESQEAHLELDSPPSP